MALILPLAPRGYDQTDQDRVRRLIENALDTLSTFQNPASGGGSGGLRVEVGDVLVGDPITTLDLTAGHFVVTETPTGEANIALVTTTLIPGLNADLLDGFDETAFGRLAAARTWTALQTFNGLVEINHPESGNTAPLRVRGTTDGTFWQRASIRFEDLGASARTFAVGARVGEFAISDETAGFARWLIKSTGHLHPGANDTYDVGAQSARVRDVNANRFVSYDTAGISRVTIGPSGASTGIEIGARNGPSTSSFIDFHTGSVDVDYDVRVSVAGGAGSLGTGTITILATGGLLLDSSYRSKYGAVAGGNTEHFQWGKSGSPATGNPYFVWMTSNAAEPEGFVTGWDGTTSKEYMRFLFGAATLRFGSVAVPTVTAPSVTAFVLGTDPGGSALLRGTGAVRFTGDVRSDSTMTIVRAGAEPLLRLQRDLANNPRWDIGRLNGTNLRFVYADDITPEAAVVEFTSAGGGLFDGTVTAPTFSASTLIETTGTGVLRLVSPADASLSATGHGFQIGSTALTNIIMDDNEIMARNNGAISTLNLNADGGAVTVSANLSTLVTGTVNIGPGNAGGILNTRTLTTRDFLVAELVNNTGGAATGPVFRTKRARGTDLGAGRSAVQTNDEIGAWTMQGWGATTYFNGAAIQAIAVENWTDTAQGGQLNFQTTPIGGIGALTRWLIGNTGGLATSSVTTETVINARRSNTGTVGYEFGSADATGGSVYVDVSTTSGVDFHTRIERGVGVNGVWRFRQTGTGKIEFWPENTASKFTIAETLVETVSGTDFKIGDLGRFDSVDVPTDFQLLVYHAGSINKWQAESIQFIYNAGDAAVALLADNTATAFVYLDPGAGADSPVGAPPTPVIKVFRQHKGATVQVLASADPDIEYHDGASFPADFRHFVYEYSTDAFATQTLTLATASSDKAVHSRLTVGTTYSYRVRAVDRAGNASANSAVVSIVANADSQASAFGILLASEIAVDRLAALSANIGIITAGQMRNAGNTAGINLGGVGGIPSTWVNTINFENTSIPSASKFTIDFFRNVIQIKDEQASPITRVELGELDTGTSDWGLLIRGSAGNAIAKLYGTTTYLQNDAAIPTQGVLITGALPVTWTRYLNLNGSGSILKHDKLDLQYDGDAIFNGQVDITAPQISQPSDVGGSASYHIVLREPGLAHGITDVANTDVMLGLGRLTTDGGTRVIGFIEGGAALDTGLSLEGYTGETGTVVNPVVVIDTFKRSGTAATALTGTEPVLSVRTGGAGKMTVRADGQVRAFGDVLADANVLATTQFRAVTANSASAPPYTFDEDPNAGIYRFATDRVGLAVAGISAGSLGAIIDTRTDNVSHSGNTTETQLYGQTITGGLVHALDLGFRVRGRATATASATGTTSFRLKFAGTTMYTLTLTGGGSPWEVYFDVTVIRTGATTAEVFGFTAVSDTSSGSEVFDVNKYVSIFTNPAPTWSSNNTLETTAQMGAAGSGSITMLNWVVDFLG